MITTTTTTAGTIAEPRERFWLASPVWALSSIVVISIAFRSIFALRHTIPRYFADEYIYVSLSRSIGHGHLQVHSRPAHFPSLLEPILAAPFWRFFSPTTAYHLTQLENIVAGSLVVIPIYLLARELRLPRGYAYVCALYSVALPMFVTASYAVTDFVAYPLVIASILAGVRALAYPTAKRETVFLLFVFLAVFARLEYFVLVPAYVVGAVLIDGRRVLKTHKIVVAMVVPAALAAVIGVLAYYRMEWSYFNSATATWFGLEAFLLAVVSGIVIAPGAIAGIIHPRERRRSAFGALVAPFVVMLMVEVSVFGAAEGRFRERYLFAILPLVALAFGVYLQRHRPYKLLVLGISAAIAVCAARLPLSGYVTGARFWDSQTLIAGEWLQDRWSPGSSSLLLALLITLGCGVACICALKARVAWVAAPVVIGLMICGSVAAAGWDIQRNDSNRRVLPTDLRWVDHAAGGAAVAAIVPSATATTPLTETLFWNPSISRELVMGVTGTDQYAKEQLQIRPDGVLSNVGNWFLFDHSGSQATFRRAHRIKENDLKTLFKNEGRASFRTFVENLVYTSWLSPDGRIRAWANPGKRARIEFTLSLPSYLRKIHERMRIGKQLFIVKGGDTVRIACTSTSGRVDVNYSSRPILTDDVGRSVSTEMHAITQIDLGGRPLASGGKSSCRKIVR